MSKIVIDSFTEAHRLHLEMLDKAYEQIRAVAANVEIINVDWPVYKELLEDFNDLQVEIFQLKEVWVSSCRLKEESEAVQDE